MAENKVPRISIQVPDAYRQHFDDMAREAGMSVTGIMSAMLLDIADDDRKAHGLPSLDRQGATFRDTRRPA